MIKNNKKIACTDILGNQSITLVDKLLFRPSAYAIIIENKKILLSKQWGSYDFPGGGIELGETIGDALKREVQEETGLKIEVGALVSCENSFFKIPFKRKYVQGILIYYICSVVGGEISKDGFDAYEKKCADLPEWFNLKHIEDIKFMQNSIDRKVILKKALKIIEHSFMEE